MISRRRLLLGAGASAGAGLGVLGYTVFWEPHWVEVVRRALPIRNLPEALTGRRLVQLSDLHIGRRVSDAYLQTCFDVVRKIAPEFVVYTGDFVCRAWETWPQIRRMTAQLPTGSAATLGILGNHDYGWNWSQPEVADEVADLARGAGIRMLRNEAADVHGLQVAGLDDFWGTQFEPERALAALDPNRAALVLSHNPDTADEPIWGDYDGWILAGHTHGGQCKPPFLPPPLLPVKNRRYTSGEFALTGGRRMYINRGVGHLRQVRFNVRPEITVFELSRA
jgi:predicted MPP superfamily phosphohydrolase